MLSNVKPRKTKWLATSALVLSAASLSTPSYAVLDEIVVSARMRAENLQDVPISETAFSKQAIEDAGIESPGDFIALTPNVTLVESQNAGISFITIRGITQVRNGESPVAVVVDDVLQINSRQLTQELFDLERIEVLRGPQGALYGRNATGGAILITTRQPTNELDGYVQVGLGEGEEYSIKGSVSGAIVEDKLFFRIGGSYLNRDGYFDNIVLNRKADPYEDLTFRGLLKWNITDQLTAELRVNTSQTEGGAINFHFQPVTYDSNGFPVGFDATIADADLVDRKFYANNLGENEREIDEFSLKVDYEMDWATLSSISSWNRVEEFVGGDQVPYSAASTITPGLFLDGGQSQYTDVEAWSQELRLTSPNEQRFRWMLGTYYLETERFNSNPTSADLERGLKRVERAPFFTDPDNPTLTFLGDDNNNTAWALFGNVDYDFTDTLEGSLALRYDRDKRRQSVSQFNTAGVPGAENRASYDSLQPKITLNYKPTDSLSFYGSWGTGFRSGQFNANGVSALAAASGIFGLQDVVDEEITETFELGFKTELAGGRARVNGAVFDTTVEDQHYFVFIDTVNAQVLTNIDEIQLRGFELEAVANIAEGFDAYASYGYTESEIKEYAVDTSTVGNWSPYVPKFTFNVGAQYRTNLTDNLGLFARADYEIRGKQYWDPENSTARSNVNLLNVRLGLEDPDGNWALIGSVNNATDEKYNSEYVARVDHPAAPRVWKLDLRYNF